MSSETKWAVVEWFSKKNQSLLDPRFLVSNVPEELVQRVGLRQPGVSVGRQVLDALVTLVDGLPLLLDRARLKLARLYQGVCLGVHVLDAVLVGADVRLDELVLLDEVLDGGEVLAAVFGRQQALNLCLELVDVTD